MYPVSNAVKALFDAEQTQVLRITGVDKNGTSISITDADVLVGSFNIDRYCCNGQKLELGTAIAAQMTLKLNNADGAFDNIVFEGAELLVEVGIADWSEQNPTVTYIPVGYFTPDDQPRKMTTIGLKALDRMTRFDAVQPTLVPWVDNNDNNIVDNNGDIIYFASELVFPCTVADLVQQICSFCNVPFSQNLTSFPNYNYQITAFPSLQQEVTYRNLIQWCAGLMGTCAFIDWDGYLVFKWYSAASYTSTMSMRYSSDLQESDITITGVAYTNTQNITIVSGTDDYAIDMTGNYLMASDVATILPNVKNSVNGFTYRPFTASVINAPYLWPLDVITFTDKDGNDHNCAVTNVNFGLNSTTSLAGKGESSQANKGTGASGVTKETSLLIEGATEVAAQKAMDNATQEQIFNKLTNNGEAQGLLLYNGKVYLNAEFIAAGTIAADFFKGVTLQLGGNNNANGSLQILDLNGNVIGKWDKDGITVNKGTIAGPSVTLGGANNVNGSLTVKDANGTTIGTWNNAGFIVNAGYLDLSNSVSYTTMNTQINKTANEQFKAVVTNNNTNVVTTTTIGQGKIKIGISSSIYASLAPAFFEMHSLDGSVEMSGESMYFKSPSDSSWLSADYDEGDPLLVLDGALYANNLYVEGNKSRVVKTSEYSDRLLYCYETPSPLFGDVGEGVIGDDGKCYVWLDAIFAETITTTQYQVFLQPYGDGRCHIAERKGNYFIVEGDPGLAFGWEIKAKQKGYEQKRLELKDERFTVPRQTYGQDAAEHIQELMKERISA